MGNLTKMRSISTAMITLRSNLKKQEKKNLEYRASITEMWSDKKKDAEVASISKELVLGRAKVRMTQSELHRLKGRLKHHNRAYDMKKETNG
jgi:hypothetical protein